MCLTQSGDLDISIFQQFLDTKEEGQSKKKGGEVEQVRVCQSLKEIDVRLNSG